jgi:hypothetical protein
LSYRLEAYDWTPFTEEELLDRLERLMETNENERGMRSHVQAV